MPKDDNIEIKIRNEYPPYLHRGDLLCEIVFRGGEIEWCCYGKNTGKPNFKKEIHFKGEDRVLNEDKIEEIHYRPDHPLLISKIKRKDKEGRSVFLAEKPEEYGTDEELNEDIKKFAEKYIDYPEKYFLFDLAYIRMTWIYQRLQNIGYRRAYSPYSLFGTGKSRWTVVIGSICYKGFVLGSNPTPPVLYRMFDIIQGTAIIDETRFPANSPKTEALEDILNSGYSKLVGEVTRCLGDNNIPSPFITYCPKLIAGKEFFPDKSTNSRTITHYSEETDKDIPDQLPVEFFEESKKLRNKLLLWRFRHFFDNYDLSKEQRNLKKEGINNNRTREITEPVLIVSSDEKIRENIIKIAKELESKTIASIQSSKNATLIKTIRYLVKRKQGETDTPKGISIGDITKQSKEFDENFNIAPKDVGGIARYQLNLELKKVYLKEKNTNPICVLLTPENINNLNKLAKQYYVDEEEEIEQQPDEIELEDEKTLESKQIEKQKEENGEPEPEIELEDEEPSELPSLFQQKLLDIAREREGTDRSMDFSAISKAADKENLSLIEYCKKHFNALFSEVMERVEKNNHKNYGGDMR